MPEPDFDRLREHLLHSGVVPRHVIRIVSELSDHYEDLEIEAMQRGLSREAAKAQASDRIGTTKTIAQHVLSRPELRCWIHRFPLLARIVLPVVYVLMLPAAPIYAGATYAPIILRWCACLTLSGVITAAMLLMMQVSITFS